MGIPAYYANLINKNPKIMTLIKNRIHTDILLFDGNSIIYEAYYSIKDEYRNRSTVFFEDKIFEYVSQKIIDIVDKFIVHKHVVFFLDGVAPIAKLRQQRERRYKSWIRSQALSETSTWNTCNITPGTEFMDRLDSFLSNEFSKFNTSHKRQTKFHLYGSLYAGEGEQKLFDWLRSHYGIREHRQYSWKEQIKDKICVYGLDSDLIMLSLLHQNYFQNIFLYRETPEYISNLHFSLDPDSSYVIYMYNLTKEITKSLYPDVDYNIKNEYFAVMNYVILFFLLGNDFIPHNPSLCIRNNGIEELFKLFHSIEMFHETNEEGVVIETNQLFEIYKNEYKIKWKHLNHIFVKLVAHEYDGIIHHLISKQEKLSWIKSRKYKIPAEKHFENIPIYDNKMETYICNKDVYKIRYYEAYETLGHEKKMVYEYFKILQWVLSYYTGDKFEYNYSYPYLNTPLFSSIAENIVVSHKEIKFSEKNKTILNPITQLLYVLPNDFHKIIPSNAYDKIKSSRGMHSEISIYFNELDNNILNIYCGFCRYFFESVIQFKSIDIISLNNVIENVLK